MKLKLIAAAAALALSGAANAAIDTGTDGSGDFFLTMWDGAQSYTVDLNLQMSDFTSGVAAPGSFSFSLNLASDAVFAAFISTANLANMVWNLTAVESQGARTLIQTYTDLPASGIPNGDARTMVSGVQAFASAVNAGITAQGNTDSAVFNAGEVGYANNPTGVGRFGNNNAGLLNFNNAGSFANNSYAAGLNLVSMAIATTGIAPAIYSPLADAGTALRAYIGPDYTLHITAAVPEPETYAMLLAGLGLMGAIARRRRQQG